MNFILDYKLILALVLAAGVSGYVGGRYVQPAKVVTEIKEVVKTVEVVKHDTTTITKEVTHPDGTKETDTTVVNHDIDLSKSSDNKSSSTTLDNLKPQWKVQAQYGYNFSDLRPVYGAGVEHRFIGPISLGAWGNTNHTAGLSASLEF